MDNHGITMKGDFETDNIKSKDGVDVIEITDATGKIEIKTNLQISSGTPSSGYVLQADGSGNASWSTPAIPAGEIILFESDTSVTGYTLLATADDEVVYISSGGASGIKSGSTWTQPNHTHTGPAHTHSGPLHSHTAPSHTHSIGGHVHTTGSLVLTVAQMPQHRHSFTAGWSGGGTTIIGKSTDPYGAGTTNYTSYQGSSTSHNHGNTGAASGTSGSGGASSTTSGGNGATGASGTGFTSSNATANTWRPYGRNYTRQQKN